MTDRTDDRPGPPDPQPPAAPDPAPDPGPGDAGRQIERISRLLPAVYHTGAQPTALAVHGELLALIAPPRHPTETAYEQGHRANWLINTAVADVGPPPADEALRILLGLRTRRAADGRLALNLRERRTQAGRLYTPSLQPDSFRRDRHEGRLTLELAMALYYRLNPLAAYGPPPRPPRRSGSARHDPRLAPPGDDRTTRPVGDGPWTPPPPPPASWYRPALGGPADGTR